ncbi:MAG: hypothetical protein CMB64_02050 [Euryarchaeota archaeon]|nr:hypothetical protein [Euryarchaeota archaeon]|tara:strand:- start:14512 stop:15360 length:849 start_codon:yes stop_codon:yes gene_type:complete
MLSVIQSVYNKNPLIAKSTINQISSLDSLDIEFQFILFNDKGDKEIINDIPDHIKNHKYFEYHYSDFNYGNKTASGGFLGAKDLIKFPFVHSSNQDDFYNPTFYSLSLKHLLSLDNTYAAVCSNCYHINEEFEIEGIPLPTEDVEMNVHWSNPTFMFDWMFGIDGDTLTRSSNFIYFPGTIFRAELYEKIGSPDIVNFGGSCDFEYWARAVFNGYKFKYLGLPTWSYMKSSYSHSLTSQSNPNLSREEIYNPRIINKYQNLWLENNKNIRTKPMVTENVYWK